MKESLRHLPHRPKSFLETNPKDHGCEAFVLKIRLLFLPTLFKIILYHWTLSFERQVRRLKRSRKNYKKRPSLSAVMISAELIASYIARIPILKNRACYWRSQLLYTLFIRYGYPVKLHFGVHLTKKGAKSHLWVKLQDRILVDTLERCARFEEIAVWPEGDEDA